MKDVGGLEVLAKCKELQPDAEVILVTGHGTIESAVEAMQQGAFNYLLKPLDLKQLRAVVENAARSQYLRRANAELHRRLDERFGFEGVIGNSPQMHDVIDAAAADRADRRHGADPGRHGHRQGAGRPGDPSEQPAEEAAVRGAQLRGAQRAHSGERAVRPHPRGVHRRLEPTGMGKFEYADGGTLFLDEVGDMPMPTQIKLLRVLESGEITRVGSNEPIKVNVRILSATNRDLEEAIAAGTFREDLYHRLKVVTIKLPRLAERREDIPLLDRALHQGAFASGITRTIREHVDGGPAAADGVRLAGQRAAAAERRSRAWSWSTIDEVLDLDDLPPELAPATASRRRRPSGGRACTSWSASRWRRSRSCSSPRRSKVTGGNREEAADDARHRRADAVSEDQGIRTVRK